jgi:hypothetical protein
MINLTQKEIVRLAIEKFQKFVEKKKDFVAGTDPTQVFIYEGKIPMLYGFSFVKFEDGLESYPPEPEDVQFKIVDTCWGVEFEFRTSIGNHKAYFDWECGKWYWEDLVVFFPMFKRLLMDGGDRDFGLVFEDEEQKGGV